MTSYRVSVLIWQDSSGLYSALPIEPATGSVGIAKTSRAAVDQVKTFLRWAYANDVFFETPDFLSPELKFLTTRVRPRYEQGDRVYSLSETFPLRVPYVVGRREDRLGTCAAPLHGIRFDFYDDDRAEQLLKEAVQSEFSAMSPRALSRFLAPKSIRVEEVSVRIKDRGNQEPEVMLPALEEIAEPLGKRHVLKRYSRAFGRDDLVGQLNRQLDDRRSSVLLVGDPGAGKSTLLAESVRQLERTWAGRTDDDEDDETPAKKTRHRFWRTNASQIIAGMRYLGEWEARCEEMIEELTRIGGILCLERLFDLLQVGGQDPGGSVAAFLMPYLRQGELRVVAEATPESLSACDRLLPGFSGLFRRITVPAFSTEETISLLHHLREQTEQGGEVTVERNVPETIVRLHRRFHPYRVLPGPTVPFYKSVVDRITGDRRPRSETNLVLSVITAETVREEFARRTGLPSLFLSDDEPLDAEKLREDLSARVIGQPEACRSVSHVVTAFKAGLNDPNRPLGVLLFCGPTGVGKTELAKALARFCFSDGEESPHFFRLDMSEFLAFGAADRMVTGPDGGPSPLIRHVRAQPFSVVLLDEIEKAHPEVFDTLLGVFEDGRLTDPFGRVTHFQSTILIMTSNIGAGGGQSVGFRPDTVPDYHTEVERFFRPEFVNRIDRIIPFGSLDREMVKKIARKELDRLGNREGLAEAGVRLEFSDAVVELLTETGFDEELGARPLRRMIETTVVPVLSRYLLDAAPSRTTLRIDLDDRDYVVVRDAATVGS